MARNAGRCVSTPPIDTLLDFPSQLYHDSIHDVFENLRHLHQLIVVCDATLLDCHHFQRPGLARAATLQECDRERDPDIQNIENYFEDITQATGDPSEEIDLDDYELQKWSYPNQDDKTQPYDSYIPFAHKYQISKLRFWEIVEHNQIS
ncbi:unnamed protein product [Cylicocyclus nassatus]|uniref:Uncharacterized protein n=1 Tax=Cylicocyclus nassatus TaxID=53992 RepID=A0AA36HFT9_CYLNA|nr:unnamed protein product [Cylicocyclus nassatus]